MAKKYKEMTYTVRADGRLVKKMTVNDKPVYIYSNTAEDLYNQFLEKKYNDLKNIDSKECNFKTYAEKWLRIKSSGKSEATIKEYEYIINKYLIPYFGFRKMHNIKKMDIEELQSDLLECEHYELAHKCIRFMKTICNDAIDNDFLIKNPCNNIKEPKVIHKEKEILTKEQDEILLNSTHKYAPFFRVIRYTGMRKEEISALTIQDIDLKNKTISINKAFSYVKNQPTLKETKNKKPRTVPILDIVYSDIKNQVKIAKENNQQNLFEKQTGGVLTEEAIRCMIGSIKIDLGFKIVPHQLRHCYCTMLYYSGITIKQTQKLMGHSSAKMVYDLYAHLDEQKERVFNKINVYIKHLRKREIRLSKKLSKKRFVVCKSLKSVGI
ncbi:MAG: site-specific integrase [Clostridia bacterium]|nr:site-specific integrase [Clostridia bacterium]